MKKKVLFVGDLRSVNNYGAVATTETLMRMLNESSYNVEYRYIDYRSLYRPTPKSGFFKNKVTKSRTRRLLKKIVVSLLSFSVYQNLLSNVREYIHYHGKVYDHVPYKLTQYEEFYQLMISGNSLQYEREQLEWADVVYINAEGNIVNGTDKFGKYRIGARYLLFMAWLSKFKYIKPTIIVNHVVDPDNYNAFEMINEIYPQLDSILVRDPLSLRVLENHNISSAKFVPDALFAYKYEGEWQPSAQLCKEIDFSQPYICIGDSSGINNQVKWDVQKTLGQIICGLRDIVPQIIFVDGYNGGNHDVECIVRKYKIGRVNFGNCSYHELYQVLKHSELFISGRWHASILSVLANTPILLWGADSHKTRSLYEILNYTYRFFEISSLPVNIPEIIEEAKRIIQDSDSIKQIMTSKVETLSTLARQNATILKDYVESTEGMRY